MDTNIFALFELEPAPALDVAALKERFARATAESHPDKFAQAPETERQAVDARYAALNQAYQTLIDPRARLLALYELTKGAEAAATSSGFRRARWICSRRWARCAARSTDFSSEREPRQVGWRRPG